MTFPTSMTWRVLLVVLLGWAGVAEAQTAAATRPGRRAATPPKTIYVATTGDDTNAGTHEAPYASIQHASSLLAPGDTLIIAGGVYRERVQLTRGGFYLGREVTITAADGERVILDAEGLPATGPGIFDTNGADYLVIRGIHVRNSTNSGIVIARSWQVRLEDCSSSHTATTGIMVDKSGMVDVLRCEVTEACRRGGEETISVKRSHHVTVADCYIHNTGHEGIDVKEGSRHVRILRNHLHDVERQALYVDSWDSPTADVRFEENVVHDCMFGIAVGSETGGELSDIWIVNNLVYNCRGPGIVLQDWGPRQYQHPMRDIHILHNTVVNNGVPNGWGGGIVFENAEATNVVVENNIVAGNTIGQLSTKNGKSPVSATVRGNLLHGVTEAIGENIEGDPMFSNPAEGDFSLRPGSPGAKAHGGNLGASVTRRPSR